jgi:mRNA interferase MazF
MAEEGQVVLFHFPQTNQKEGKLRPALLLQRLSGCYNDWLFWIMGSEPGDAG